MHIELLQAAPDVRLSKEANAGCSYIVPDFLVEMTSGQKRLVEVKPSDRLAKPLAQRKLSVARQYAATEGWAFSADDRPRSRQNRNRSMFRSAANGHSTSKPQEEHERLTKLRKADLWTHSIANRQCRTQGTSRRQICPPDSPVL